MDSNAEGLAHGPEPQFHLIEICFSLDIVKGSQRMVWRLQPF